MRKVRVFVSSPKDVADERRAARAVIEQLKARFQDQVEIDALLWESQYYEATELVQTNLPRPSTFDIVVLVLWSTLGGSEYTDPLTGIRHASGTRFEIADVLAAPANARPTLLVCHCKREFALPGSLPTDDIIRRKTAYDTVTRFVQHELPALGIHSVNEFVTPADFAETLQATLIAQIKALIDPVAGGEPAKHVDEPYKGLRVLTADDHGFFFGRKRAIHRVVDQLRRQDHAGRPFVIIFGKSGVGKSSFARAGVVPHIVKGRVIEGVRTWRTAVFEPSDSTSDLIGGLAAALTAGSALPELVAAFGSVESFASMLRANADQAVVLLRSVVEGLKPAQGTTRLILLIDPMEEIFTRGSTREDIERFGTIVRTLCESRLIWVIGTSRIDFYEACVGIKSIQQLEDGDGHFRLQPLSPSELKDAVVEPAVRANVKFGKSADGEDLADALVNDALKLQSDPLPLLAYALQQLYERSNAGSSGAIPFSIYEKLNRLEGLLDARADEARKDAERKMVSGSEAAWNEVFFQLVGVEADNQRVRLFAKPEDFKSPNAKLLLKELNNARLLVTDKDDQGNTVISIAHEAMLRQWRALSNWMDHREAVLKTSRSLNSAADLWRRNGRHDSDLTLLGIRLAAAEHFLANPDGVQVPAHVAEFVRAHVVKRDKDRSRRRLAVRLVSLAMAVALGITFYSYLKSEASRALAETSDRAAQEQARIAREQTKVAETQRASARKQAQQASDLTAFIMKEVRPRLGEDLAKNRESINAITDEVTNFMLKEVEGEEGEDAVKRVGVITRVGRDIGDLARFDLASKLQEHAIKLAIQNGFEQTQPMKLAGMHLDAADYYERAEDTGKSTKHVDFAKDLINKHPGSVDPLIVLDLKTYEAMAERRRGRYTNAIRIFKSIIPDLQRLGPTARPVLARAIDSFTEALRYAGHEAEGYDVYTRFMATSKDKNDFIQPRYQVEYSVFLGLLGPGVSDNERERRIEEASARILKAIADSQGQDANVAQYQYKLARIFVVNARPGETAHLATANQLIAESEYLLRNNGLDSRLSKCLEVKARLRLKRGEFEQALIDAREVYRIRKERKDKNKDPLWNAGREYLDACVLMVDCLRASKNTVELTKFEAEENEFRQSLIAWNNDDTLRANNEKPANFERTP